MKFVSGAFMPVVGSLSTALVNWWSDGVKDFVARFDGPAIVKGIVDSLTKEVGGSGGGAFQSRMDVVLQAMANTFKALAGLIVAVLVGLGIALGVAIAKELGITYDIVSKAVNDYIVTPFNQLGDDIKAAVASGKSTIDEAIDDYIVAPFNGLVDKIKASWAGIKAGFDNLIEENIIAPLKTLEGKIRNADVYKRQISRHCPRGSSAPRTGSRSQTSAAGSRGPTPTAAPITSRGICHSRSTR